MHLILTGATGLVGSAVLDAMLSMPEVTRISILSRRPIPMLQVRADDPLAGKSRVNVYLHQNFDIYDDELLQQLRGAEGIVWALGISQTQVDKEEYVKITRDYPLAAAKAFRDRLLPASLDGDDAGKGHGRVFRFVYVSGEGATTKPNPITSLFGRTKGETELALADLANAPSTGGESSSTASTAARPQFQAISVRPGGVDASQHPAIQPFMPRRTFLPLLAEKLLIPAFRCFYPSAISPTMPLGRFLTETAMGRYDDRLNGPGVELVGTTPILANVAFRRLACL